MSRSKSVASFPIIHTQAAGIDVGSRSNWVCAGGTNKPLIKEFGVFTEDHHSLANWLKSHKVTSIAMESTGVYWKSLFLVLQSHGFDVQLVNARHVKNVSGKKSDISDCQWLWQLHRVGLLRGSFQPDEFTEILRTYNRQRRTHIEGASQCVNRMQKALTLMNVQLHLVVTDLMGKSGRRIIEAILAGERDPFKLADLADRRIKASKADIAKALRAEYHEQQVFVLRQHWRLYESLQLMIAECDERIDSLLLAQVKQREQDDLVYEPVKKKARYKNAPNVAVDKYAYQLSDGVDLMQIDGISYNTVLTLISEVGLDLASRFPTAKHFTSWLGLCPNRKITGGKLLSSKSKKNKSRLAVAFRQAANTVGRQKDSSLSYFFRRLAFNKGRKLAITATARKLAVIVYNMLAKKMAYQAEHLEAYQEKVRCQKIKQIQRTIKKMNIGATELGL